MNKAFMREADGELDRCPGCGARGVSVGAETLDSQLADSLRGRMGTSAYFCRQERCEIVYFDEFERRLRTTDFDRGIYPKDPQAPICTCFGLCESDVADDVSDGTVRRIREVVDRSKTDAARCRFTAPSGECCVTEVQRVYFRLRGQI